MYRISQGRIFYGTGCGWRKEKEAVEAILLECTSELRELYEKARWGNGQKWLMIDLEDQGEMFADVLQLIEIRRR